MTTEVQRQTIKDQVEAGEERLRARHEATLLDRAGESAIEAKDRFTAFAKEHPVTTVAAGLALGVLISGLFPRSPTRRAGAKVAGFAAIGAETAMAFLHQAMEAASHAGRAGADRLDDWGDTLGDTARHIRRDAAYSLGEAGDTARATRREASKRLRRALRRGH